MDGSIEISDPETAWFGPPFLGWAAFFFSIFLKIRPPRSTSMYKKVTFPFINGKYAKYGHNYMKFKDNFNKNVLKRVQTVQKESLRVPGIRFLPDSPYYLHKIAKKC